MSVNKVILVGRLGADPEVRTTQNGTSLANLRLATSESWRDKNTGEKQERTEWHTVVVWGDGLVNAIERNIGKGCRVYVEGQLQTRKWQDQQGADRYSTEVVVRGFGSAVTFIDFKDGGRERAPSRSNPPADMGQAIEDTEIPF